MNKLVPVSDAVDPSYLFSEPRISLSLNDIVSARDSYLLQAVLIEVPLPDKETVRHAWENAAEALRRNWDDVAPTNVQAELSHYDQEIKRRVTLAFFGEAARKAIQSDLSVGYQRGQTNFWHSGIDALVEEAGHKIRRVLTSTDTTNRQGSLVGLIT